jgi:twitching motility protein PilT
MQMRIGGNLKELKLGQFTPQEVEAIIRDGLTPEDQKYLEENMDFDAALIFPGLGRFRASFYKQQKGFDAVFRPIPLKPPTLSELGLPANLNKLADFHQGLVLFTGPAGSGKSSTLAAIVNMLNESRQDHIITVEDPIEYVFEKKKCIVNQRQAGKHTKSFANALRAALREDPDIIVIGELYVKPAVSNLIREEKTFQIRSLMQTGRADGMMLLDDSIADLVKTGQVTKETARRFAEDPKRFA